jgi:hypothetical protein
MKEWNKIPYWNPLYPEMVMNPIPPTLYSIMNSIANYGKDEYTKIRDLAGACREKIFDFEYELSSKVDKENFEKDILNHFMMRRIGFETFTAFQLYLENKLHEILPYYNVMFDALSDYNLFNSGEVVTRNKTNNREINAETNSQSESRYSEYPLNQLNDINSGEYVSNQNTNSINANNKTNDDDIEHEVTERSPSDKMEIYKKYLETRRSIMSMIYKELDILFYGLVE